MLHSLAPHFSFRRPKLQFRIFGVLLLFCGYALAQRQLPYLDVAQDSPLAQLNLDEMYRQQLILRAHSGTPQQPVEAGTVSALDIQAPGKAIRALNQAASLLKEQKVKEAVRFLQKAIEIYPKFVSAHIDLGLAYFNLKDNRAKDEFETATKLDDQVPVSFLYLGMMSLSTNDFPAANASLEKAAFLSPRDPQILNALALAQYHDHKYTDVLQTVDRLHKLDHQGAADVHYIAAAAAISLNERDSAEAQLNTFLREDPAGPLAAIAREKIDELTHPPRRPAQAAVPLNVAKASTYSFPNSERLKSQLAAVTGATEFVDDSEAALEDGSPAPPPDVNAAVVPAVDWATSFTIRKAVDETALFLAVSSHGKLVSGLSPSDIHILDDGKPPQRILEFMPQSQLPLRLGVLIDTSGSVEHRITFEKAAARKFLERVLNPDSDLAFVASFDTAVTVTQDFTSDTAALSQGVENLARRDEGTAVFDAIHFACWKLAALPEHGRVARVLVVLTDGEDNSSSHSLKQAIEAAEAAGITVYTFNTSQNIELQSDANKVLQVIAARSGGESVYPRTMKDLEHYFSELSDAIRSRYLIAYKPAGFVPNGSYRRLKVNATHDGKSLQVHVRKGYYARLASNEEKADYRPPSVP